MRIVLPSVVLLAATSCGFSLGLGDGKRRRQCETLIERVARAPLPAAPPELALSFRAEQLHVDKWHPHGGSICYYAALAPQGWTAAATDEERNDRWSTPDGGATLSYALLSAATSRAKWVEGHELAPVRARGQVQREHSAVVAGGHEKRRLLVTREGDMMRLVVVRWSTRDDGHFYFRCEASLAPAYAPALPLFEAVCDAARVRHWEYPPW